MAVGSGTSGEFYPITGVKLSATKSGVRYADRLDLVLIEIAEGSCVAGVYTKNDFCAAPVLVTKAHIQNDLPRYFLINTGNANAGTGEQGKTDALRCCDAIAKASGVSVQQVLPYSTGVIGEALPTEKILQAVPDLVEGLAADNWQDAAEGILTTDTRSKLVSVRTVIKGQELSITGIAKGSGMIKPNMATMLAFIFTDAYIDRELLDQLLTSASEKSFNRITIDGDTSTNDCCMLVSTGTANVSVGELEPIDRDQFVEALEGVFTTLAKEIIKDGEGASKFVTITVSNGKSKDECLQVAYLVAESPLVKTALFASDPNWGRILAVVGRAKLANLAIERVTIDIGDVRIVSNGGVDPDYLEERGQQQMDAEEIEITIDLNRGESSETIWTSDLSHDYVRINAEYRT